MRGFVSTISGFVSTISGFLSAIGGSLSSISGFVSTIGCITKMGTSSFCGCPYQIRFLVLAIFILTVVMLSADLCRLSA